MYTVVVMILKIWIIEKITIKRMKITKSH